MNNSQNRTILLSLFIGALLMPAAFGDTYSVRTLSRELSPPGKQIPRVLPGGVSDAIKAQNLYDQHNLDAALVLVNKILVKDPLNPMGHRLRAQIFQDQGDFINAMSDLEQIRVAPWKAEALSNHGYCYANLGEFGYSLNDYNASLAINPGSAQTYCLRAEAKRNLADLVGAQQDIVQSLKIDPSNLYTIYVRGNIYFDQQKYPEALADLKQCEKSIPNDPSLHFQIAQCLSKLGRKDEAATEYKTASTLYGKVQDSYDANVAMKAADDLSASANAK